MNTPPLNPRLTTQDVEDRFLDFFTERGHRRQAESSLLTPLGDPVLFTTSGMHPLTPYLEGRPHPLGRRLTNVQRCLRTTDVDEVGDPWHLTVFEMLGTWSLGDYSGRQSLSWGFELLRDGFDIDPGRLHVTVFGGNEEASEDTESRLAWSDLGLPVELTDRDNWWSNGPTGLCGPDSEIFLWTGHTPPVGTPTTDDRWIEIWNHVMMRYRRDGDGGLNVLDQPGVDTGMGLERMVVLLNGRTSVFDSDLFEPWTRSTSQLWSLDERPMRILCDHLRSSVVVIGEGVRPSNKGRGYVLRRLIRRALTVLWRGDPSRRLSDLPTDPYEQAALHFRLDHDVVELRRVLEDEERRFVQLIERGRSLVQRQLTQGPLTEDDLQYLRQTHGLPRDLVLELLVEPG